MGDKDTDDATDLPSPALLEGEVVDERQALVDESRPIDGEVAQASIREATIFDLEKNSAYIELRLLDFKSDINHKKKWSDSLLSLVGFITVTGIVLVFFVGLDILKFSSPYAIPAFIAGNLLEVFGLSIIVVQYLFPNHNPKVDTENEKESIS